MRLAALLARMLEPAEREAVLGDLAESGETGAQALGSVAGLVARRQAVQWKSWRPWAILAAALAAGCYLSDLAWRMPGSSALGWWIVRNYRYLDPAVLAENDMSLDGAIWLIFRAWVLVPAAAWIAGFVLGLLARRTRWVHAIVLAPMLLYPMRYRWPGLEANAMLAATALAPLLIGLRSGRRKAAV